MAIALVRVAVDRLEGFTFEVFRAMGLSEEEARLCTKGVIQSELRCPPAQNQGVKRLPTYHERISKGYYSPGAPFEIVKESSALALVDAHNGLGSVTGQRAMALAVSKAKAVGVGTVSVRHSTHWGSSGVHARIASDQDCIGIAMTNAGPEMPAWGGMTDAVGTNPWGIAAPSGGEFPLVLDIGLNMPGKLTMRWLKREGATRVPKGWALGPDGNETEDINEALQGVVQAIGGHKGYGLSMMTDVLTGVLSGSAFGLTPYSDLANLDVGHLCIAIDIGWFMPVEEFKARIDAFIAEVKGSKLRPGFDEILVPGELDCRWETERRAQGVEVEAEVFEELRVLAGALGIGWPF